MKQQQQIGQNTDNVNGEEEHGEKQYEKEKEKQDDNGQNTDNVNGEEEHGEKKYEKEKEKQDDNGQNIDNVNREEEHGEMQYEKEKEKQDDNKEEKQDGHGEKPQILTDDDDDYGFCLDFVFQDWQNPEMFTDHSSDYFEFEEEGVNIRVKQGTFEHTPTNDQTGAVVWDDAIVLGKSFLRNQQIKGGLFEASGKKVLDLGSGTGFLGLLLAAGCQSHVVVSDRIVMKDLLELNVELNVENVKSPGSCCFIEHSWGEKPCEELLKWIPFDIILAGGCIYHEEANPLLVSSIKTLGDENTKVFVGIDFRFDVSKQISFQNNNDGDNNKVDDNEDDENYMSPVIRSFFRYAYEDGLILNPISNLGLKSEEYKSSIRIFSNKI